MQAQRLLPFFRAYLCRAVRYDDVPEKIERTSEMSVLGAAKNKCLIIGTGEWRYVFMYIQT